MLIGRKTTITIISFQKKFLIKVSLIQNSFKWMFVYHKCCISVELMFLNELMLIKQVHQKSVILVTIGISYIIVLSFNEISAIDDMIY